MFNINRIIAFKKVLLKKVSLFTFIIIFLLGSILLFAGCKGEAEEPDNGEESTQEEKIKEPKNDLKNEEETKNDLDEKEDEEDEKRIDKMTKRKMKLKITR